MIRDIEARRFDSTDRCIVEQLKKFSGGCKIGPIVCATAKSEGACRYRLLTLEACGIVRTVRERGATRYFLNKKAAEKKLLAARA